MTRRKTHVRTTQPVRAQTVDDERPVHYGSLYCSVLGCENPVQARNWCNKHYSRWRRHGNLSDPVVQKKVESRQRREIDWRQMADDVVSRHFTLPDYVQDDARSEAVYRGWLAFSRYGWEMEDPYGYVYSAMRLGVKTFIRRNLGDAGQKIAIRHAISLDFPTGDGGRTVGEIIPAPEIEDSFELEFWIEEMYRWIREADLSVDERQIIWSCLLDEPQTAIAQRMKVSTSQVSKLKWSAIDKIREYANLGEKDLIAV